MNLVVGQQTRSQKIVLCLTAVGPTCILHAADSCQHRSNCRLIAAHMDDIDNSLLFDYPIGRHRASLYAFVSLSSDSVPATFWADNRQTYSLFSLQQKRLATENARHENEAQSKLHRPRWKTRDRNLRDN